MKKSLFILLLSVLALCVQANTPHLSRSELRHVANDRLAPAPQTVDNGASASLRQLMRERHHASNVSRLNSRPQASWSVDDVTRHWMVWIDAKDFDWDDENGVAIVDESSHLIMGKYCTIQCGHESDSLFLTDFFDSYEIPIDIDFETGRVTIQAGVPLDVKTERILEFLSSDAYDLVSTLYAVPMSWLTGDDDLGDICGTLAADGTIMFDDGFALLVNSERDDWPLREINVGWSLSPIFTTFWLLKSNGTHQYMVSYNDLPGILEPLLPPDGHGGLVPRPVRPGTTKPVKPRPLTPGTDTLTLNGGSSRNMLAAVGNGGTNSYPDNSDLNRKPVYVYQLDDTTLMVYNLYGTDFCWNYMFKYRDGSLVFPGQKICEHFQDGTSYMCYNASRDSSDQDLVDFGNTGQANFMTASWNDTYLCTETGAAVCVYTMNRLVYHLNDPGSGSDSVYVSPPTFADPQLTDTTVVFGAETTGAYCLPILLMLDEETGDYSMAGNPLTVPRRDEPYWIHLAAYTANLFIHSISEMVWLDYEVPALEAAPVVRGDVNGDTFVTIDDVTALINALLTDRWDVINVENANCNLDEYLNIDDVTAVINFLLTDQWPE